MRGRPCVPAPGRGQTPSPLRVSPAGLVPTVRQGVMSVGRTAKVGGLGPSFSVLWTESCPPRGPMWKPNPQWDGLRMAGR